MSQIFTLVHKDSAAEELGISHDDVPSSTLPMLGFSTTAEGGSGESSGDGVDMNTVESVTVDADGEEVRLVSHDGVTPSWQLKMSSSEAPQESRSEILYRPLTTVTGDAGGEQQSHVEDSDAHVNAPWSDEDDLVSSGETCPFNSYDEGVDPSLATDDQDLNQDLTVSPPTAQDFTELLDHPALTAAVPDVRASAADACLESLCLNGGTCVEADSGGLRCLCLSGYSGTWCQTELDQCEPGWEKFQGFCYRHFSSRQSWDTAEQHCRTCGGHLVSVMTPEEQHYINDKFKEHQWIGLNDRTIEGDFRWSDGNPLLYENWSKGQPDSYFLSGEDCAVMVWHDEGHWSDVPCNYHLSYTCKKGVSSCGEPPKVAHAKVFGKKRPRFETNSMVRYYCEDGFTQRLNPVIKCLPGGHWEAPQVTCVPNVHLMKESAVTTPPAVSPTSQKSVPRFWFIRWDN